MQFYEALFKNVKNQLFLMLTTTRWEMQNAELISVEVTQYIYERKQCDLEEIIFRTDLCTNFLCQFAMCTSDNWEYYYTTRCDFRLAYCVCVSVSMCVLLFVCLHSFETPENADGDAEILGGRL